MLQSDKTCYWKASRAIRKNNFNCTNVVDDVEGGSKISNLFKEKYKLFFNSVKCSEDEYNLLSINIDLEAKNYCCDNHEVCKGSECTHCNVIRSSEVMCASSRAGQRVTNLGTVGNRYGFEFSILLIETAWAGRIVFSRLTVYLIVNRISTN